eukprot:1159809-Pelagomonas_calceolata.AAC.7
MMSKSKSLPMGLEGSSAGHGTRLDSRTDALQAARMTRRLQPCCRGMRGLPAGGARGEVRKCGCTGRVTPLSKDQWSRGAWHRKRGLLNLVFTLQTC